MNRNLCVWLGFISGAWVGLVMSLLRMAEPSASPPIPPLALDGLVVSVVTLCLATAFACMVSKLRLVQALLLVLLIGVPVGLLLGPIGFHLKQPILALLVTGAVGALIGLFVCRLLCSGGRVLDLGASR
jgi:uncharacterized membrane protein